MVIMKSSQGTGRVTLDKAGFVQVRHDTFWRDPSIVCCTMRSSWTDKERAKALSFCTYSLCRGNSGAEILLPVFLFSIYLETCF